MMTPRGMWAAGVRAGVWVVVLLWMLAAFTGCVSPHAEGGGKFVKLAHTEVRSPFGTNDSFAKLQRCDGPTRPVLFYLEADFSNCVDLSMAERLAWEHGYSQGQGGQILGAVTTLAGFGWLAEAQAGANLINSATATASGGSALVNIRNGKTGRW